MNSEPRISSSKMDALQAEVDTLKRLPIRFRRDPADLARIDPERGTMRSKHPRAYYLDGQPDCAKGQNNLLPDSAILDRAFKGEL